MTSDETTIDELLASALRGDSPVWPAGQRLDERLAVDRIAYHGIAGLLNEAKLDGWPEPVMFFLRQQAIALAMWELRHRVLLGELLSRLADTGIVPLILKGTALAYDLYPLPATRARGDTDILVAADDLSATRSVLSELGYRRQPLDEGIADDLALQEVWSIDCDAGTTHHIDLHWQLINAPALGGVLKFATCVTEPLELPKLAPEARAMNRPLTLLHNCIHRAMHLTSPYIVEGTTYYGGDRLIWAKDIALLAGSLSAVEWEDFRRAAIDQEVAAVCVNGLEFARRTLRADVPDDVSRSLKAARVGGASAYLLGAGQAKRAWLDFVAIRGWRRKLAYLAARSIPSAAFMRGKYPAMAGQPLVVLHLKRMTDLVRPRPRQERPSG